MQVQAGGSTGFKNSTFRTAAMCGRRRVAALVDCLQMGREEWMEGSTVPCPDVQMPGTRSCCPVTSLEGSAVLSRRVPRHHEEWSSVFVPF